MILLAIVFPGFSFLIRGKVLSAILAIILQLTIVGWLPVAIWAVVSLTNARSNRRMDEMERRLSKK